MHNGQVPALQALLPSADHDVKCVSRLSNQESAHQAAANSQVQNMTPGRHAQLEQQATLCAQPAQTALVAHYNKPNSTVQPKQYFCEACTCLLAARQQDWQIHIAGTRHQHQLVSLQHTGQLGNVLQTVFEAAHLNAATAVKSMFATLFMQFCASLCTESDDKQTHDTAMAVLLNKVCRKEEQRLLRLRTAALS